MSHDRYDSKVDAPFISRRNTEITNQRMAEHELEKSNASKGIDSKSFVSSESSESFTSPSLSVSTPSTNEACLIYERMMGNINNPLNPFGKNDTSKLFLPTLLMYSCN